MAKPIDKRPAHFLDMDGCIVKHYADPKDYPDEAEFLPGSIDYLLELINKDCYLVLTTGRSKHEAHIVIKALEKLGIKFHQHVYDLPTGERHLHNDKKWGHEAKAFAYNHIRNQGMKKK